MEIRRLRINAQLGIGQLEELLAGLHYQKKEYVALPGEFAVRSLSLGYLNPFEYEKQTWS